MLSEVDETFSLTLSDLRSLGAIVPRPLVLGKGEYRFLTSRSIISVVRWRMTARQF